MPSLLGCCCQPNGGCNGWWSDPDVPPQVPASGFGLYDTKYNGPFPQCTRPDGTDCGVEDDPTNCCGPSVPAQVSVNATTWWDWAWGRQPFGYGCQGGLAPDDPPEPVPHCGQQNWTVWEGGEGWTWVQGGGLGVILHHDNEAAIASGNWSSAEMRPSCCAHYYYGSAYLAGPSRPAFDTNPWDYLVGDFTCSGEPPEQVAYGAPGSLRVYARMVLTFKGEGPNNDGVQPRIVLQAKLELYIGLDNFTHGTDGVQHYIDGIVNGNLPGDYRAKVAELYGFASVDVRSCNCTGIGEVGDDAGVNVIDKIQWGLQPTGAYWNYAHPHPGASDDVAHAVYGTGSLGGPCGKNCEGDTFSLHAYSCCTDANPTSCPSGPPPDSCTPQEPHCWTTAGIYNFSRKRHGLICWSTAGSLWSDTGRRHYDGSEFGANDDTSWHCYSYSTDNPCNPDPPCTGSFLSIQTSRIKGGFVSSGPATFFPNPGLRDLLIGVGDGSPV